MNKTAVNQLIYVGVTLGSCIRSLGPTYTGGKSLSLVSISDRSTGYSQVIRTNPHFLHLHIPARLEGSSGSQI